MKRITIVATLAAVAAGLVADGHGQGQILRITL